MTRRPIRIYHTPINQLFEIEGTRDSRVGRRELTRPLEVGWAHQQQERVSQADNEKKEEEMMEEYQLKLRSNLQPTST
jgi:hypothetical protein